MSLHEIINITQFINDNNTLHINQHKKGETLLLKATQNPRGRNHSANTVSFKVRLYDL